MAIKQAPKTDFLYTTRANFHSFIKRDGVASIRDAQQALKLNPTYQLGFGALAFGLALTDDLPRAIEKLEYSMTLSDDDPLESERTFPLAVYYFLTGQFEKAQPVASKLLHIWQDDRVQYKLMAMILRELGEADGAAKLEAEVAGMPARPSISSAQFPLPAKYDAFAEELWSVARP